jgi:hypothetical protein
MTHFMCDCLESLNVRRSRRGARPRSGALLLLIGVALCGCQSALPRGLALGEDAKIAKQAKADGFPSPGEVGLTKAPADP